MQVLFILKTEVIFSDYHRSKVKVFLKSYTFTTLFLDFYFFLGVVKLLAKLDKKTEVIMLLTIHMTLLLNAFNFMIPPKPSDHCPWRANSWIAKTRAIKQIIKGERRPLTVAQTSFTKIKNFPWFSKI